MKYLKNLIKAEKSHSIILEVLFLIYILFDIDMPQTIRKLIDTSIGNIIVILLAGTVFMAAGPIAGILALVVAYTLIKRSRFGVYKQFNHEEQKMDEFEKYNEFPKTLEEEVISNMAPIVKSSGGPNQPEYSPILDNINNASPIDYEGVI